MNKVILIGRLVRDPELRYTQAEEPMAIARYTLAVERRGKRSQDGNESNADFISCVAFGRLGEFAEKYLQKGLRVAVTGRIQTAAIQIRKDKKYIRRILLLKNKSLLMEKEIHLVRASQLQEMDL